MRKRKFVRLGFLMTFIIAISCTVTSFATEIDDARNEKNSLEKRKEELDIKIQELEIKKNDAIVYINILDKKLSELTERINNLNIKIEDVEDKLKVKKKELKAAEKEQNNQYEAMKKRIKYIYENGNSEYIEIIMNSKDISDFLNRSEYISKISEYDNSLLEKYKSAKEDVEKKTQELNEKLEELKVLTEEVEFEKSSVEVLVDKKSQQLKEYEEGIGLNSKEAEDIQKEIDAQEELIEKYLEEERKRQEELLKESGGNNIKVSDMGFAWPLPSSGRITSYFGNRNQPTAGASTYHKGIDIGAPTGSHIVASVDGTVVTSSYSSSAGNYLMLSHGGGVYTLYMHCSKLLANAGDTVKQGDVIALVGSTGISTGSHLHFAITIDGTYVDPQSYVSY